MAEVPSKPGTTKPAASASAGVTIGADPSKQAGSVQVQGAPFQIQPLQAREAWLKMLIYAGHGRGKTELAGTAADVEQMRDVLLISADKGEMTLTQSPRIKNSDLIDIIPVTTFNQIAKIQEFLKAHCRFRDSNDEANLRKLQAYLFGIKEDEIDRIRRYKTVIFDSLTEAETYCTYRILDIDINEIESDPIDVAGWPEFRKNFEMIKLTVRAYRDLPMNVIFLCPDQWTQDEQKRFHYTPYLTGKLSEQVQGFVDIVGWLTVGSATETQTAPRRLYVESIQGPGIPKFDAKNRRSVYGKAWFDNPSMTSIMEGVGLLKKPVKG